MNEDLKSIRNMVAAVYWFAVLFFLVLFAGQADIAYHESAHYEEICRALYPDCIVEVTK